MYFIEIPKSKTKSIDKSVDYPVEYYNYKENGSEIIVNFNQHLKLNY